MRCWRRSGDRGLGVGDGVGEECNKESEPRGGMGTEQYIYGASHLTDIIIGTISGIAKNSKDARSNQRLGPSLAGFRDTLCVGNRLC